MMNIHSLLVSKRQLEKALGTFSANMGTLPELIIPKSFANFGAFFANAYAKQGHAIGILRPAFQCMKSAHADNCAFIDHLFYFFRD